MPASVSGAQSGAGGENCRPGRFVQREGRSRCAFFTVLLTTPPLQTKLRCWGPSGTASSRTLETMAWDRPWLHFRVRWGLPLRAAHLQQQAKVVHVTARLHIPLLLQSSITTPFLTCALSGAAGMSTGRQALLLLCLWVCLRCGACCPPCGAVPSLQVWAALTLMTEIRHRVVAVRMLHLTGTVTSCQEAAERCHAAEVVDRRLTPQQAKLADEAAERLKRLEV